MGYLVKEVFYTLQGEGAQAGRPAVFLRFSGCNLWTGRERHRAIAVCQFCDTDFVGGSRFSSAEELVSLVASTWGGAPHPLVRPYVVCTGGEPLLQLNDALVSELHAAGFEVGVETNGTRPAVDGLDWLCVSPKAGAPLVLTSGDELKLVYPQPGLLPPEVEGLRFDHLFLQPMDGPDVAANTKAAVSYCLANPQWRLSIQSHKVLGIP